MRKTVLAALLSVVVGAAQLAIAKQSGQGSRHSETERAAPHHPTATIKVPLVLISIDGLKPDYVLNADKLGLKIPNLRRLVSDGTYASGVTGVLPTVTYPSHTTMVTGVSPAKHGIISNTPFDPFGKNFGGWYWYAEDIKVPTLWDVAAKAKISTASVDWPVTVGANIKFNIAQYWRAENAEDRKIIRALSTPGLLTEAERAVGPYTDGNDYTVEGDLRRAPYTTYILKTKRPGFMVCYFGALDEEEHKSGPYSPQAFAVLEKLDSIVGQIRSAAVKIGGGHAFVCVVSDHGFMRTNEEVNLNSALREAGLIEVDEKGSVKSWRAFAWSADGSAGIMLRDRSDGAARKRATEVMLGLVGDQSSGVDRIIYPSAIPSPGGFPDAAFVVTLKPGYRIGTKLQGPVTLAGSPGGTHGYAPDVPDMNSSFFIVGPGIGAHQDLGQIDMRDIAPTLAGLMALALPEAEGHDLKVSLKPLFTGPVTMASGTAQPPTGAR